MDMWVQIVSLIAFQAIVQCAGECVDLDPLSCIQMAQHDPAVCKGTVAPFVCPSFCGTCTPTCYDCHATSSNYTSCTKVKTCQAGEKCIVLYSDSTIVMQCASQQICDSVGGIGSRSIQTASCCSSDRCNFPTTQAMSTTNAPVTVPTTNAPATVPTTNAPVTVPTTNKPATVPTTNAPVTVPTTNAPVPTTTGTVNKPVCYRDIEIMVQDSRNHTFAPIIKQYLKDMVNSMEVGPHANMFGVALFDNDVHKKFSFKHQLNKTTTLHAIDHIRFQYDNNEIDKGDVAEFLHDKIQEHHVGDRLAYPNIAIIIVDHKNEDHHTSIFQHLVGRGSETVSIEVIVINVGVPNSDSPFMSMATDANHVLHAHDFSDLPSTLPKLLELICID